MKVLDDLYKKETLLAALETKTESATDRNSDYGYYAKLKAYLLLLYQAYLKKECALEPEIKMSIWRMVSLQEDFIAKIEMAQQYYLDQESEIVTTSWGEAEQVLFPLDDTQLEKPKSKRRQKIIDDYKGKVLALLNEKP